MLPPDRLDAVRALADAVFVHPRARLPGVRRRFPGLLEPDGLAEAVAIERDGEVLGALAVRPLSFREGAPVAAIGLVAVRPEHRSHGTGTELLQLARRRLEERGFMSAVLWARRHELYTRAGWRLHDEGVRAEVPGAPESAAPDGVAIAPVDALGHAPLAALRARWEPLAPERPAGWWHALPFPATEVRVAVAGDCARPGGYALFGVHEGERYLYELIGAPETFGALWQAVRAGCANLTINERRGGASHAWLAAQGVRFGAQALALWLALAAAAPQPRHVPWFDRI